MKRVLFVDDEANVLQGLQRMLRPLRHEWEMSFCEGGDRALELMEQQGAFDILVTDVRMPHMDGAQLLAQVMETYPQTVRMILSGHTDSETLFRVADLCHQFITKPCDAEHLKNLVERAFALRGHLDNERLQKLLSNMHSIPSVPTLYLELMKELRDPEVSMNRLAGIVAQDFGMCAKLLQFVNSAYFGLKHQVSNPLQAINYIGVNNLRSLILSVSIFSQADASRLPPSFSIDKLWKHSMVVAAYARAIARVENNPKLVEDSYTAGLLHDAGILVLAVNMPDLYEQVLKHQKDADSLDKIEMEIVGATHGEVGAYLLSLWGLPDPIVEAVAYHHKPSASVARTFNPLFVVHLADALHNETGDRFTERSRIDRDYFDALYIEERMPLWREACHNIDLAVASE